MEANAEQVTLLAVPPTPGIVISAGCTLHTEGDDRVVFVAGTPTFRYHTADRAAEALVVAQLLELDVAKPKDVAAAFGVSRRTVHRRRERYVEGGVEGVVPKKTGPKGPRLGSHREAAIRGWHAEGRSGRWMASQLGVSPPTVTAALRRMGLPSGRGQETQAVLPAVEPNDESSADESAKQTAASATADRPEPVPAPCASPLPVSLDPDPSNRVIDRMLARRGELDDAAPLFASGEGLAKAGVLLCVPIIWFMPRAA